MMTYTWEGNYEKFKCGVESLIKWRWARLKTYKEKDSQIHYLKILDWTYYKVSYKLIYISFDLNFPNLPIFLTVFTSNNISIFFKY